MGNVKLKKGLTINELEVIIRNINPNPNVENVLKIVNDLQAQSECIHFAACAKKS